MRIKHRQTVSGIGTTENQTIRGDKIDEVLSISASVHNWNDDTKPSIEVDIFMPDSVSAKAFADPLGMPIRSHPTAEKPFWVVQMNSTAFFFHTA